MSLEAQRDLVGEFAAARGLTLVDVVAETASGAVKPGDTFSYENRPGLLALRERAQAGEFDALIVPRFDRLSRDYASLVAFERLLQFHGVTLYSAAEETGDGPIAEFMRGQLALVAQLERAMILERVGAGKAKKKARGRHVHGRAPYGYTSSGGVLRPAGEREPFVRRIFKEASAGMPPGRIARGLNEDAIPPPQRGLWSEQGIRVILRNPAYVGERYGVKRAHESIVSRRLWNAAQRSLDGRARV